MSAEAPKRMEDGMEKQKPVLTPESEALMRSYHENKAKLAAQQERLREQIRNYEAEHPVVAEKPGVAAEPEFPSVYHKGASHFPNGVSPEVEAELKREDANLLDEP